MQTGMLIAGTLFIVFGIWSLLLLPKATQRWRVARSRLPQQLRFPETVYLAVQRTSAAIAILIGVIVIAIAIAMAH